MTPLSLAGLLLLLGLVLVASFTWVFLLTRLVTGFVYSIRISQSARLPEIGQVTAIVPMRNEVKNVDGCLSSLLSDPAVGKIIVVDDNSNDGTQDAVRRYCHNKQVELLDSPELQKGWSGKSNACYTGALASDSSWLLFIDADTFVSSDIVSKSVDLSEAKKLDAVTCFGGLRCRGIWDKIAVPFYFALLNSFVKFGGNKRGEGSYFMGSFILIKRSEYFRIGGHAAVAGELVEDKALSDVALKSGLRIGMAYAPKLVSAEWAPGFKNGTQALSREILPSIRHKPLAAVAFASALTLLFTLPLASMIISLQPYVPFGAEFLGLGILCISFEVAMSISAAHIMQCKKRYLLHSLVFIFP
ncbi:MAG: glycosyltransferase, partial [Thaumarchaeota archaeon]|nr:glycosyltransferase [Nitrososphaerota archaeon]